MANTESKPLTLKDIQTGQTDPAAYAAAYLRYLAGLLERIDAKAIAAFIELLRETRERGSTVFFLGNGGSAATASHFANDISVGTQRAGGKPFRAVSLTDNVAVITAIGNDEGYDRIFVDQLRAHLRDGDAVVAISASGNSPNVVAAVDYARNQGATVCALTGFDGGKLKPLADIAIHVPTEKGEYGPVEDLHMVVDHLVSTYLIGPR